MESTLRSFINRVDFVKNSEMGHPIYRVTFTPSKGKTMIGYTRSKSHLSQICPSFEGDTCDVTYDINDKGKVIVRDIKKCGGEMNESFKRSGGFISHDGNGMVGGRWESWTVEGVWTPLSYLDEKINEKIHDPELTQDISEFIEGFYNDDEYGIVAIINGCYDESVGIRPDAPEYRIEEVTTDNFDTWIKEIDSSKFSFEIKTILKNIIKQMFDDAYDVDIDEYEIDYSDYDYDDYLNESQLHRIVGKSMNRVLKENANVPDFYDFIDILERNGWSYSDYQNVQTKDGRSAKRYIVYKDDKNSSDFKTLQQGLKNTFGDNVDFGIAQYRYAPEIKHYTVIILDYNDDDASAPLNESKLRRIVSESIDKVLNEVGDTPKGQRKLGALHARKHLRDDDYETIFTKKSKNLYDYIKNARGGDKYDYYGNNLNPMYANYANGYMDYLKSHPQEYIEAKRRRQMDPYSIDK
jgi:hypothetical protein